MAIVRKSALDAWSSGVVDLEKVRATTDLDIERQMLEDDETDMLANPARLPRFIASAAQHQAVLVSPAAQQSVWIVGGGQTARIPRAA